MLLNEIKKTPDGTYVGVKLTKESRDTLYDEAKKLKIPNLLDKSEYHITVIYSRKHLPNFEPLGKYENPIVAKPKTLSLFTTSSGNPCLVIELTCPKLEKRHEHIMKVHGATYDWDEYKCHITLSYDCEDFDIKKKNAKKLFSNIEIETEYEEPLNTD